MCNARGASQATTFLPSVRRASSPPQSHTIWSHGAIGGKEGELHVCLKGSLWSVQSEVA